MARGNFNKGPGRPDPNPTVRLRATRQVRRNNRVIGQITAEWEGGPYIDLYLAGSTPVEVINVWDFDKGGPEIPFTQRALARTLEDWIDTQDEEWPEWYEGYLENS